MAYVVAYVAPGDRGETVRYGVADTDAGMAGELERAERGWIGELVFDIAVGANGAALPDAAALPARLCEPGYALIVDQPAADQQRVIECFEPAAFVAAARRWLDRRARVIGVRLNERKPAAEPAWSDDTRALHRAIAADPGATPGAVSDDDRLVFADALGGKRGSFVIVQCDLVRDGMTPAESRARRRAQRAAIAQHGAAWSRLAGLATRCRFHRGFVDSAELRLVLGHRTDPEQLADAAPLARCLAFDSPHDVDAWLALPGITGAYFGGHAGLPKLALPQLRAFGAYAAAAWDPDQIARLALADLDVLQLDEHNLRPEEVAALVAASPALRVLHVESMTAEHVVTAALPASLRELRIGGGVPDYELADLARIACAPALEKLALRRVDLARPAPLAAFRALRSLDLIGSVPTAALAEVPLPALRELRCPTASAAIALAVATAFGDRLELLDLRGAHGPGELAAIAPELRERVAGDVWLGDSRWRKPLMAASYEPFEPMWDVADVELSA